jgi:NADH:ubiquinone oxidoreductase subunit 6 (subunit J)
MELLFSYSYIPFYLLASIAVICSLGMILYPNLVRAGFLLIGAFTAIAGLYFMLFANFVAVSQILIYAVGIVLVIIFAIMLCSLKETASDVVRDEDTEITDIKVRRVLGIFISSAFFFLMISIINSQNWDLIAHTTQADQLLSSVGIISKQYTTKIGAFMLSNYLIAFELISILLLIVLVGVIILSKKNISNLEAK